MHFLKSHPKLGTILANVLLRLTHENRNHKGNINDIRNLHQMYLKDLIVQLTYKVNWEIKQNIYMSFQKEVGYI
jgi:hypothetical protein